MIRELAWYLEEDRYTNLAAELEGSLRRYEEAKKESQDEGVLSPLREDARLLFEDHSVRSGLRESGKAFINIDAEFFDGDVINEEAKDAFVKNIVMGHCYQKHLWLFMGTTGLMTPISKGVMAKEGRRYEEFLPIEYKKKNPSKKPLADRVGKNEALFYVYGDGTASQEYMPEKAKIRFDRLKPRSSIDFSKGYHPENLVSKDGWHGTFDHTDTWVMVESREKRSDAVSAPVSIELVRSGNGVILYDPGMLLLSSPLLMYVTENGEPYGNLSLDREKTLDEIRRTLKAMGVSGVSAVGGISGAGEEKLQAYREVLKDLAAPGLEAVDAERVRTVKEEREREALAKAAEESGVELERDLSVAAMYGGDTAAVLASVASGTVAVPLSPRKAGDRAALGLTEEEAAAVSSLAVRPENAKMYDTVLSNLYAAWAYYEGSVSKAEAAVMVNEYLESYSDAAGAGHGEREFPVINAQTSLGAIIDGGKETSSGGVVTYSSGIPGVFSEGEVVDFYNEGAKEKYLKALERKKILPKGGAAAALAALKEMPPQAGGELKAKLNRSLTRALGQYQAIAMSTGMPLAELIEVAKARAGFGKDTERAELSRKVYYEVAVKDIAAEAGKENRQKKEVRIEEERLNMAGKGIVVIGGIRGSGLDEVVFTREKLTREYGFSAEEAAKAQPFLRGVRLGEEDPALPVFLADALLKDKAATAADLRRSVLGALEARGGVSYNLSTDEGIQAYHDSGRGGINKIKAEDIQALLQERKPRQPASVPASAYSKLEPRYRALGDAVAFTRNAPKGSPEKIRFAGAFGGALGTGGQGYGVSPAVLAGAALPRGAGDAATGGGMPVAAAFGTGGQIYGVSPAMLAGAALPREAGGAVAGETPTPVALERRPLKGPFALAGVAFPRGASASALPGTSGQAYGVSPAVLAGAALSGGAGDAATGETGTLAGPGLGAAESAGSSAPMLAAGHEAATAADFALAVIGPETAPVERRAGDMGELLRLRKVEANYERDKAEIAKRKQPALARSESHDVGHAVGTGTVSLSPQEEAKVLRDFMCLAKGEIEPSPSFP